MFLGQGPSDPLQSFFLYILYLILDPIMRGDFKYNSKPTWTIAPWYFFNHLLGSKFMLMNIYSIYSYNDWINIPSFLMLVFFFLKLFLEDLAVL